MVPPPVRVTTALTYYPLYSALGTYANPGSVNYPMAILIVVILVNYVGMTYGPIGAVASALLR